MPSFSTQGGNWIGQRFGFALNGVLGATGFFLLDWALPRWLKNMYILYDFYCRTSAVELALKADSHSRKTRWLCFATPTISLIILRVWIVPFGREILYHHGFVGYALILGIKTLEYILSDGPPDERRHSMFAHRDAAVCYFFTAYALIHRWWLWSVFFSWFVNILVPMVALTYTIWMLRGYVPEMVYRAWAWLVGQAAALFMWTWDFCDKIEAHIMERFPKWFQYNLHRYQQAQRKHVPAYTYTSLQPGEIRLLNLRRTSWWLPGSIEADLIHVPMDSASEYEAVSYRWGSSQRTESILLDGASFVITRSAYNLLIARRSIWRSRTVWIDAICINQADEAEKAAQVQLMREIYHQASRVVIFTGGGWTARLAAPLLYETVAATYQFDDPVLALNKLSNRERSTTKWKALKELVLNDYFTRAWIVQEVSVGEKVELYYGGLYISWSVFFQLAMHLAHPHRREMLTLADRKDRAFYGTSSLENIAFMSFLRPTSSGTIAQRTALDAVLYATFTFRATDPRDKVFSVLGIAKYDDPEGLLLPDYSKSVSQVYRDTAEHLFFHSDKPAIHMLALAGIGHTSNRLAIPSWVASLTQEHLWFPYTDFINQESSFRASGDSSPDFRKGEIPDSLSIRGVIADTVAILGITTVHDREIRPSGQQNATYVTREKYTIITDITACIEKYEDMFPTTADMVDRKLWLALVAGRIDRQKPSERREWSKIFDHWVGILKKLEVSRGSQILDARAVHEGSRDLDSDIEEGDVITYDSAIEGCYGRRFAITEQGRLCWVPPYAEVGDVVFVPFGAQTPFLIRAKGKMQGQDVFELVGESYVQGIMWGELMGSEFEDSFIVLV